MFFLSMDKHCCTVKQAGLRIWFVEQMLMLSSSLRCDQIYVHQRYDFGHTLLYYLSLTWMFNQPALETCLLNKCSCLARALSVTKFTYMRDMILVTLCCGT